MTRKRNDNDPYTCDERDEPDIEKYTKRSVGRSVGDFKVGRKARVWKGTDGRYSESNSVAESFSPETMTERDERLRGMRAAIFVMTVKRNVDQTICE